MGIIHKIQRDTKKLDELIKWLEDNKSEIKDIILSIRLCNGNLELFHDTVPLETMCTVSKMLDMAIDSIIMDENPKEFIIEEDDDEDAN